MSTTRYELGEVLGAGGFATVHLGRFSGDAGFARTVAIKRVHPRLAAADDDAMAMLVDEARLLARVHHPNVVGVLDVVAEAGEVLVVMELVQGEPLSALVAAERPAPEIVSAIALGLLEGLHAAHEARDEQGAALALVHRDVSPQNILVGSDGIARVCDFGIAKARGRLQVTAKGMVKGKLAYLAPEQLRGRRIDRRTDVYAAGALVWEALTGRRLFTGEREEEIIEQILLGCMDPPSAVVRELPAAVDDVVMAALSTRRERRPETARAFADALSRALPPASPAAVAAWVERIAGPDLRRRAAAVAALERTAVGAVRPATTVDGSRGRKLAVVAAGLSLLAAGIVVARGAIPSRTAAQDPIPVAPAGSPAPAVPTNDPTNDPAHGQAPRATIPAEQPTGKRAPQPSLSPPRRHLAPKTTPRAHASAPKSTAKSRDARCAMPFTIDADGTKRYNRECL